MNTNAIKLPFKFDAKKIQKELEAISTSFQPILSAQIEEEKLVGVHLITPDFDGRKNEKGHTYHFSEELKKCPYLQLILDTFQSDKFMFRTQNLKPGGKIEKHRDRGRGLVDGIVRLNIPVTTNEDVHFLINGERIPMQNGECWLPNVSELHEVENRSDSLRMQLMIDCDLNDWWKTVLKENGIEFNESNSYKTYNLEELQEMRENFLSMKINTEIIEELQLEIEERLT